MCALITFNVLGKRGKYLLGRDGRLPPHGEAVLFAGSSGLQRSTVVAFKVPEGWRTTVAPSPVGKLHQKTRQIKSNHVKSNQVMAVVVR